MAEQKTLIEIKRLDENKNVQTIRNLVNGTWLIVCTTL